ncbi:MAG: hypothetical protein O2955_12350 [Planctomycetota bacterium]|nr:hypothetical protein [Planctomycetota bacterium]MDA1213303.1 hypothetical protein [Planctomycetota bacterium]
MRPLFLAGLVMGLVSVSFSADAQDIPAPTEAEMQALEKVKTMGGQVTTVAQTDPRVEIGYHLAADVVTDDSLAPLAGVNCVVSINLRGTPVTDAGLAHIAGMTNLKKLHLEKTTITDAGIAHLKGLSNLEYLNIYGTGVTDAGIDQLAGLTNLKKLYIWETAISDEGQKKLKAALPELQITGAFIPPDEPVEAKKPAPPVAAE